MTAEGYQRFKQKHPRKFYLEKGLPLELSEDNQPPNAALTEEERSLWNDAKSAVYARNKKPAYLMTFSAPLKEGQWFSLNIEVLHHNYRGFQYTAKDTNLEELEKKFWPTIQKLCALYISPRVHPAPDVPVPICNDEGNEVMQ